MQKKAQAELKHYEEERKLQEEEALELIDGFTEGTWIVDCLTGTIKCSKKWSKRIGLDLVPEKERIAYTLKVTHPGDTAGGNSILNYLENGAERFDLEYRIKTVDSGYVWMQNKGKITYNENGEAVKIFAVIIDITKRKKIEEALRESERNALELVEKLRQYDQNKNTFFNILSHELRNPLASIMMSLDLQDIVPPGGKQALMALEIARRQGRQLSNLVEDLLEVSRISQNKIIIKKETVELNELINKAVQNYQPQFLDKNVGLQVKMTSPIYIEADSCRLTQAVGNLLHNAVKYTRNHDQVIITVSEDPNTGEAVITVQDTGRGIEPEAQGYLFEAFMQVDKSLDRSQGGLGLGLPIVKAMVELHNGRVEVFSEGIGKGSRFTIRLPLPAMEQKA